MQFANTLPAKYLKKSEPYVITVFTCVATTLVTHPLQGYLDQANIVMLFLLTVFIIAVKLGRNAAILASVLSVLCFDVFFVPPHFSLAVSNLQYLITFAVMLVTALTTTHFTSILRQQAIEAAQREQQTEALYQLAKALAGTMSVEQVGKTAHQFVLSQLNTSSLVLYLANDGQLTASHLLSDNFQVHMPSAELAMAQGLPIQHTETLGTNTKCLYLPLIAPMRTRGVMVILLPAKQASIDNENFALLDALASLIAVALERLHYVEVAQANEIHMQSEHLRNSILSALSHDLRTPLTAMVGLADALFLTTPPLSPLANGTATAIREQAQRLSSLVGKLLNMARLNTGQITLRREWQPLEEVVGASIKLLDKALCQHQIKVNLDKNIPLLAFDAVLIERVLGNLLENAAKYAPTGTTIEIRAERIENMVTIEVCDQGGGFPDGEADHLFDMFIRGSNTSGQPGSGLGLAICKAIVLAHGGSIKAINQASGGACVRFTLAIGTPPCIELERS